MAVLRPEQSTRMHSGLHLTAVKWKKNALRWTSRVTQKTRLLFYMSGSPGAGCKNHTYAQNP